MGFTLAEAVVFFKGDDKQLSSDLKGAEQKTQSSAANMAKFLGGAIVGGATVAAGAIIGIGKTAFDVASQLDAATDQIGASLGLSADEAKAYGQTIKDVYGNNFGDSIEDVGVAIENVAKQLKLTADDPALKTITENAFRLRDVFGVEVSDSVNAANTLMDNFGLTGDEAFDLIAAGYKSGLDSSGDFLDTIGEYSVQFAEGGASAGDFFSILSTGLQGGVLGTDKAADLFKEFRVRIQDGSTSTAAALNSIGLSSDEMAAKFADGSLTAVQAFEMVQTALWETKDTNLQFQAGVALLGTQFEDLGADAALAINTFDGGFKDLDGAVESLDSKYTSLGGVAEGMWRKFQVGIAPAGEAMLAFVNDNLPAIQTVVDGVSAKVVEFIELIPAALAGIKTGWDEDWGGMRTTVTEFADAAPKELEEMWISIGDLFAQNGQSTSEGWENFLGGLTTGVSGWILATLDSWGMAFQSMGALWDAWSALFRGDWEGYWTNLGEFYELTMNQMLNWIEFFFGPEFRNAIVGGLTWAWDGMKDMWDAISGWWNSTFGSLGLGGVGQSDLGIVNPQNMPQSNSQQFLNDMNLGLDRSKYEGVTYPGASTSSYKFGDINVNVGAGVDPYSAGRQVVSGINDELRARGF